MTLSDEMAAFLRETTDRVAVEVVRAQVRGLALRLFAGKRKRRRAAGVGR